MTTSSTVKSSKRKREEEEDDATANSSSDESSEWGDLKPKDTTSTSQPNQFADDFEDLNLDDDDDDEEDGGYEAETDSNKKEAANNKKKQTKKHTTHKKTSSDEEEDDEDDDEDDVYVSDEEYGAFAEVAPKTKKSVTNDDSSDDEVEVIETFKNEPGAAVPPKKEASQPSLFDDVDLSDDSSEDESIINTVGNIPLKWYEEYDHIGYDRDGNKILRKKRKDALDNLLARHDDPNYIRTVYDDLNDKEVVINNKDLQMILDVNKGRYPTGFNPYKDYVDYVKVDSRFPLVGIPTTKASFIPNKDELKMIAKLAAKMRKDPSVGVPQAPKKTSDAYLMWGPDGALIGDKVPRVGLIQPYKVRPPGHDLSYNPAPEFVKDNPAFSALRQVPAYDNFIQEQYKRCLDLYMRPRSITKRKKVDPEKLLPELPKPEELRPYPEIPSIIFEGHGDIIRKLSVDPTGKWLLTGADDHTVRLFESKSGRLVRSWLFDDAIRWVEWNPNSQLNLFAVAVKTHVYLIHPKETGTEKTNEATKALFPATAYQEENGLYADEGEEQQQERKENGEESTEAKKDEDDVQAEQSIQGVSKTGRKKLLLKWKFYREEEEKESRSQGIVARLEHLKFVTQVTWHHRGDYFATLSPDAYNDGIVIHQLSRRQSQKPFKKRMKEKGNKYVRVLFHPKQPLFFVSTTFGVKVYNLQKQKIFKKLRGQRCKQIIDMVIHPTGGHVLTGGADHKSEWFDMELSTRPFKTLRYHKKAVKSVAFHPRYPLFATSSDDGLIHVFHCTIYQDDWLKDPNIVPLKILRGHRVVDHLGVQDIQFHPTQPWLFSAGVDGHARLWIS